MESHSDSVYAQYGALFAAQQHVIDGDLNAAESALNWVLENPKTGIFSSDQFIAKNDIFFVSVK